MTYTTIRRQVYRTFSQAMIMLAFTSTCFADSKIHSNSGYQQKFIQKITPKVQKQNIYIQNQRNAILQILHNIDNNNSVSHARTQWLYNIARVYKVKSFSAKNPASRKTLLLRVNTLPTSLVLAQAINESNWGRSRFAKKANNLFGMWCYQAGCGIIPLNRAKNKTFEVKSYSNQAASIQAYFYNLNTNPQYSQLRQMRNNIITKGNIILGLNLANYLTGYSADQQYGNIIKQIIKQHGLVKYDKAYR